ncbi:hypothetical protein BDQ17DRAFT_1343952 [Cyathus striatus]|nr:hypothetical protein BDQ17DRAFT_1343952 [Cyathus striatus]
MLVSTPTKSHFPRRNIPDHVPHLSPISPTRFTPSRLFSDPPSSCDSPMPTPSPLRHHQLFANSANLHDPDDLFLASPFRSPAPAHSFKGLHSTTKPQPISADDEEGSIFLSDSSSLSPTFFSLPSAQPSWPPVKPGPEASTRSALGAKQLNSYYPPIDPLAPASTGIGTKRKSTPLATPLRAHNLTPLRIAPATAESTATTTVPFDRLAPLPAPKFTARTPQSKAETEAYLRRQTASLTRLKLNDRNKSDEVDDDSGCEFGDEDAENVLFLSNARLKGKARALEEGIRHLTRGRDGEEVAAAVSPGGHITKRRARSRPVSAELQQSFKSTPRSPVRSNSLKTKIRPRHPGSVAFPTSSTYRSPTSSPSEAGSPRPRRRVSGLAGKISPPLFLSIPQTVPRKPHLNRNESASSATLFFGPPIPQPSISIRSRNNTTATPVPVLRAPQRPKTVNRHSYAGPDTGLGDLQAWHTIQSRAASPSPKSSPLGCAQANTSLPSPGMDDDEDMFFAGLPETSFVFSVTEGTPSAKKALPKKYKPKDSGVASDEEDMHSTGSASSAGGDFLHVMPRASTSVTSVCSFEDGLVTPVNGPEPYSGWPGGNVIIKESDSTGVNNGQEGGIDVDAFIIRTLAAASKDPGGGKKRIPGTPVKKMRTIALADRPWQSAVASKVGLRDDCDFRKGPRKSLPAAFPPLGGSSKGKNSDSTDTEGEEDSPSGRRNQRYAGVGLGRPTVPTDGVSAFQRNRWLMRRSSSGAFSSGSDASMSSTPTRPKTTTDWTLPKPRIPVQFSPTKNAFKFTSPERSASGSSTSSTVLNSPTTQKHQLPHTGVQRQAQRPNITAARRRSYEPFGEEQPGRFERDFDEIDEVGSGDSMQDGHDTEVYAIKKSKRFEGAKHRLRLREEVDILKHLSRAAIAAGLDGRHPNVLTYTDSWEEDEALFIRTELCESGNLARFLWEYGRAFPRLDEARVWKIVVDLSNGLRFIHDAGVIHLDLKPSNVFVTKEGRFKIGDFGMASVWPRPALDITSSSGFEREGDKLYLAPEVLQGKYGKAADIFSFGMTILETTTNIVVPDQGDEWHRLRREDFSQVTGLDDRPELFGLIKEMMRTESSCRISIHGVCDHPVVSRARIAMERMFMAAKANGTDVFVASPLASVPEGFLEEILNRAEDDGAMDICG